MSISCWRCHTRAGVLTAAIVVADITDRIYLISHSLVVPKLFDRPHPDHCGRLVYAGINGAVHGFEKIIWMVDVSEK